MIISLDTETTGLDFQLGTKPFLVTTCDENGDQVFWEWDVDPLTRQPRIPKSDLKEIQEVIDDAEALILQNAKFDVAALQTIFGKQLRWNWKKTFDTLFAGHLLASNQPHDLTTMSLIHLNINLEPYEDEIKQATNEARRLARSKYPTWRIAKAGLEEMPSAKGTPWKYDMWLPRALVLEGEDCEDSWETACADYANSDSAATLPLFLRQKELLKERNLWKIYKERLKLLPIIYNMQQNGITLSATQLKKLRSEYKISSARSGRICMNLAKGLGFDLELPKSGNNKSLTAFIFNGLKLEPFKTSKKTGAPSLDKECLEHYQSSLPRRSKSKTFVNHLLQKRKRDTALNYMESYEKFWVCCHQNGNWFRLYPSLNPTGTNTLRWSSQNPNEQNISKKEGFNLRSMFGPMPGREWWSLDAKNIELRLPAYEANETEMVKLFQNEHKPPYFGSYHMLIFDTLHPKKFEKYGVDCKKVFASTWYQWTKNGNFAVQYGAVEQSGTADRAYHVEGAQHRIQQRFSKIKKLNERMIAHANQHGYVETIPDRTIDPKRGYPLMCTRTSWGKISPTIPLNYHIQGSAMWWMMKAMIRCQKYLDTFTGYNRNDYQMIMQVHDELVFDFPYRKNCGNRSIVGKIKKLMEEGGNDFNIPTPVSCEYHDKNWSEGISVTL